MRREALARLWRYEGLAGKLPAAWRRALALLAPVWLALVLLTAREWGEMFHQWWNIDTYNHILLVPLIIAWLAALRRDVLARIEPWSWFPGLVAVAGALCLWLAGRVTGINLLAHAGAVAVLQGSAIAILGPRATAALLLPIGFMAFLVPFGDEIIPPLQAITAHIAIALTHWSGIPAAIDGIHINTPVGLFIVAEACSGVKFLVAMFALGVLVCFTAFESWGRRAVFMLACIIVPIIANGIRAWGTIYIAQFKGVEFAAGFDHIFYGWIFFAIVVGLVLAGAWRFIEREPEDAGFSLEAIGESPLLARLEGGNVNPGLFLAGLGLIALGFLVGAIYAPVPML